ncbi:MAG: TetR/AcrR family transcriptional regulator [Microthrixaceae bacterium]
MARTPESDASSSSSTQPLDRRAARRIQTKAEILEAAWDLVRERGLAGLAMRDLGKRLGMKAQSIYSYFESKNDIYDRMFRDAYMEFNSSMEVEDEDGEGVSGVDSALRLSHRFFEFCTSDPVRYQLLFQRTIPDFVPSEESYAVAVDSLEKLTNHLADLGVTGDESVDLFTSVLTGLTDQQISNDPGGNRWGRIVDRAVLMLLREVAPDLIEQTK